jgi:hypothetical protein
MNSYQLPPTDNPKQFEQLLCDMLNEHYQTVSFKTFGKNGHAQKGIDLISTAKKLIVQCKHKDFSRGAIMIKKELLSDIEGTLTLLNENPTNIEFDTLIIATTGSEHPDYDEYTEELRQTFKLPFQILFWGWETIQNKLSGMTKTLAGHYPQYPAKQSALEDITVSRVEMKKKIERDFRDWLNFEAKNRKFSSRVIIHSSTDKHYPKHQYEDGPWFWFRAEISRMSTNGLGFVTGIREIYVDQQFGWTDKPQDSPLFTNLKVAEISVVDLNDIVAYDNHGDEHYNSPHFYIRFNENNTAFCEVCYQNLGSTLDFPLFFDETTKLS